MLCGVQAKGLSYQATSKMLERQANNVLKCRTRAWLSRLMSWRTLTSNTHGLTGLVAQANWGNLWPLCHFPLPPFGSALLLQGCLPFAPWFVYCQRTQRGAWQYWLQIELCTFSSPFHAPSIMRRVCCAHTNTHTHTSAQSTQLLSVLIWFIAYSRLAKRTQP